MGARALFKEFHGVDLDDQYTTYAVGLTVRNLMVGGVPGSPSVIRGWLKSRLEMNDAALDEVVEKTLRERFGDSTPSIDEQVAALMEDPDVASVNGFKRIAETGELAWEGRCAKAAIKEAANSAYPGTDWAGKSGAKGIASRKGLLSTLAERVFVVEDLIGLGVKGDEVSSEPEVGRAWVEERVKHVQTPQGPKSAIARVEVVKQPSLTFTLKVHDDFLSMEAWGRILTRLEDIGVGADRGRSDGQFDLTRFEKIK